MSDGPRYVSFRDYVRVVRERRVLVVLMTLLFGGAAFASSVRQDPVYSAEASLEFQDEQADASIFGRSPVSPYTPEQRAAINSQTITRPAVLDRAREILGRRDPVDLGSVVAARPEARTNLVVIQAVGPTAEAAANRTNAVARAAREVKRDETRKYYDDAATAQQRVLRELRGERGSSAEIGRLILRQEIAKYEELANIADPVVIRRPATASAVPISPKPVRTTVLGVLIGLTFGLLGAFIRDSLDRRFKSTREITEELHLPLLGYVREDVLGRALTDGKGRKPLSDAELEGFRILRTNVEFLDVDRPPKVILITSALPSEGKSTIASALAAAYATSGKRTLLVECDLRRPTLAERLGVQPRPGLTDYLVGQAAPPEVLQTISVGPRSANGDALAGAARHPLVAIVAGSPAPQPAELLRSQRCQTLFEQVRDVYDVIVVDTPPLLSVVDTLELLPLSDAVVVCVRASQTTREQARAAKAALGHFPERPTGVVVTGVRAKEEAAQYGYYSYGYVYGGSRR